MEIEPRSTVRTIGPSAPGFGTSRRWTRRMGGKLYSFTAVIMPNGERRYAVSRYDGPDYLLATGTFDCDWTRLHFVTVPESPCSEQVWAIATVPHPDGFDRPLTDAEVERADLTAHALHYSRLSLAWYRSDLRPNRDVWAMYPELTWARPTCGAVYPLAVRVDGSDIVCTEHSGDEHVAVDLDGLSRFAWSDGS